MKHLVKNVTILILIIIVTIVLSHKLSINNSSIFKFTFAETIKGDVNGDNLINIKDAKKITEYITGISSLSSNELSIADYNNNGTVKMDDTMMLLKDINNDGEEFYDKAKELWDYMVNGDKYFSYKEVGDSPIQIPITISRCNCSAYISWALYEFGYTDFEGDQWRTRELYKQNWSDKYGWEEIYFNSGDDITSMLKKGDIVVRVKVYSDGSVGYGHTNIVASNGGTSSFDCGYSSWVKNGAYPNGIQRVSWYQSGNPGKIIRPTKINK